MKGMLPVAIKRPAPTIPKKPNITWMNLEKPAG